MNINDLPTDCEHSTCLSYADDVEIFFSEPSIDVMNTDLSSDLNSLFN